MGAPAGLAFCPRASAPVICGTADPQAGELSWAGGVVPRGEENPVGCGF